MENLFRFIKEHAADDVSRLILDRKKYPCIDMDLAVNCIESLRKLKGKVQEWYDEDGLIFPIKLSAEQCSSSATGRHKAQIAADIAGKEDWILTDLTGGLGVDSWFFSQKASKVVYNEMQEVLCEAARHNFKVLNADNIYVTNKVASAQSLADIISEKTDIVYLDPARRGAGGKKVFLIEECTPDILTLKDEIFKHTPHILIKLSPMADITMVCDRLGSRCREVHVVSAGGECKELLIWMDRDWDSEYTITATELYNDSPAASFTFHPSEEKNSCYTPAGTDGEYLFEPGKSMMKAGAYNLISCNFKAAKLGRSTHYYMTDSKETAHRMKPHGKLFQIIEKQPLDKRSIKDFGKKYPKAEVTARNIPMDTETLRKKLGITSGDDAHIFGLKSDIDGNIIIATKRIY